MARLQGPSGGPLGWWAGQRGITLVEASIVLAAAALVAAALAPAINGYLDRARQARARADLVTIAGAVLSSIEDNGQAMFLRNGSNAATDYNPPTRADANRVELLVSDGDIPTLSSAVSAESFWTRSVDGAAVDTLSNHLIENLPNETAGNRYRNPTDITNPPAGSQIDFARAESSGFNAPYAWRGPYLRGPVRSDPWGNRYGVNVGFLDPRVDTVAPGSVAIANITAGFTTSDYPRIDVFVVSAGPDQELDTRSAQEGAVPGDDDFIYIVTPRAK